MRIRRGRGINPWCTCDTSECCFWDRQPLGRSRTRTRSQEQNPATGENVIGQFPLCVLNSERAPQPSTARMKTGVSEHWLSLTVLRTFNKRVRRPPPLRIRHRTTIIHVRTRITKPGLIQVSGKGGLLRAVQLRHPVEDQ